MSRVAITVVISSQWLAAIALAQERVEEEAENFEDLAVLQDFVELEDFSITAVGEGKAVFYTGSHTEILGNLNPSDHYVLGDQTTSYFPEAHGVDPIRPGLEDITEEMLNCSNAVRDLIDSLRTPVPTEQASVSQAGDYLESYIEELEGWRSQCLESDSGNLGRGYDDAEYAVDAIRSNLGYIYLGGVPFCSGMLVTEDTVLTARHCFSPEEPSTNVFAALETCKTDSSRCSLDFSTYANPSRIVTITGDSEPEITSRTEVFDHEDYIRIRLRSKLPAIPVVFDVPRDGEQLFAGGFVPYFDAASFSEIIQQNGKSYFPPQLLWSRDLQGTDECVVKQSDDDCIYHTCQTWNGFSGTPLLRSATTHLITVVGLHIGGPDSSEVCGASSATSLNRGVSASVSGLSLGIGGQQ